MVFAQAIDLKNDPALIAEYVAHHRAVWPEVTAALRRIGIRSMRIFLTGNRLFMCFEAPDGFDPARDFQAYASDPRAALWDQTMRAYQVRIPSAAHGGWWQPMDCVFDLDWFGPPS